MSIVSMLKEHNSTVLDALICGFKRTTVYHLKRLTVRIANQLRMTYFKNMEDSDPFKRTLLTCGTRLQYYD